MNVTSKNELFNLKSGIVCLDEFWLTMDSRKFAQNIEMSEWALQARKKRLLVFYTTQTMNQVDNRVRQITDWWIHCDKRREGIWLNFVLYQYGTLGARYLLNKPENYHSVYDTEEVLSALAFEEKVSFKGVRGVSPRTHGIARDELRAERSVMT